MFERRSFLKKAIMFTAGGLGISKSNDKVRRTVRVPLMLDEEGIEILAYCPNCDEPQNEFIEWHDRIGCNEGKCTECQFSEECKKLNGALYQCRDCEQIHKLENEDLIETDEF